MLFLKISIRMLNQANGNGRSVGNDSVAVVAVAAARDEIDHIRLHSLLPLVEFGIVQHEHGETGDCHSLVPRVQRICIKQRREND